MQYTNNPYLETHGQGPFYEGLGTNKLTLFFPLWYIENVTHEPDDFDLYAFSKFDHTMYDTEYIDYGDFAPNHGYDPFDSTDTTPPVADAGPDQTVLLGRLVEFDGSASSDDILIETYEWSFEYDGESQILHGVNPLFNFDVTGTYTVTLTVTDEAGNADTDTMVVNVLVADVDEEEGDDKGFIPTAGFGLVLLVLLLSAMALSLKRS